MNGSAWPEMAASVVHAAVVSRIHEKGCCSVMLTGGRSACRLYEAWVRLPDFNKLSGVSFYFGDERCVPPDHPESNYGMAMRTLFGSGIPVNCFVHRIEAEAEDVETASDRYALVLPRNLDVLLLGVGEDGHIASLFPCSRELHEERRRVVPVNAPKPPYRRLTITPPVIRDAGSIYILAAGADKAAVLEKARQAPDDIDALPARLVFSGTWLLE